MITPSSLPPLLLPPNLPVVKLKHFWFLGVQLMGCPVPTSDMVLISFNLRGKGKEMVRGRFAGGREEAFLPQSSGNFPLPLAHSLADLWLKLPKL